MEKKVHEIVWTDENVNFFWNYYNNNPAFENLSFSKESGTQVINMVGKYIPLQGKVLDYGTSKGYFTDRLLQQGSVEVYSCDFSEETITKNNNQFAGNARFKGCSLVRGFPSSFQNDFFDVVFLLETIEHLTDKYYQSTFEEIRRMLKPGGYLVVTTPNDEDLSENAVCCPECGCVFHRVQHVRSFNSHSLANFMSSFQFRQVMCGSTDLKIYGSNGFLHRVKNLLRKQARREHKLPHLVYIGRK